MRGFLHCYCHSISSICPVEQEFRNTFIWLGCGFDRLPSRDAVDRFLTGFEHIVDEVFDRLVEQAAMGGLLDWQQRSDTAHRDGLRYGAHPVASAVTTGWWSL